MPYRRTQFAQDQYYHIYNRGSGRQPIFVERDNYLFAVRLVEKYAGALNITMITYCLMPNHYHFLPWQDGENPAGLLPQRVFNCYAKAFNKRYDRTGTLLEGCHKSIDVDRDDYLLHLCRYIHVNPLVDRPFVKEHFPTAQGCRQFVLDYLAGLDRLPEGIEPYPLD